MMTKKKAEPVVVHKVYTARHAAGSSKTKSRLFGKCICGAVLEGREAVDEHKLLEGGPPIGHLTEKAG